MGMNITLDNVTRYHFDPVDEEMYPWVDGEYVRFEDFENPHDALQYYLDCMSVLVESLEEEIKSLKDELYCWEESYPIE